MNLTSLIEEFGSSLTLFIYSQARSVNQRPFSVIRRAGYLWGSMNVVSHTVQGGWPEAHVEVEEGYLHLKEKKQFLAWKHTFLTPCSFYHFFILFIDKWR